MTHRVLITGAFGYLGGRLAAALERREYDLVLLGRTRAPWAPSEGHRRRICIADVLDVEAMTQAMRGVDAVVHLASLDEIEATRDPELAVRVSGEGTRRLLNAAVAAGASRFVFLSTFHVYGPRTPLHVTEQEPTKASHPYAIAHLVGEGFCRQVNLGRDHPFAVTMRLSNAYGAPADARVERWTLAHNDFCRQACDEGVIVLKTPGTQHRDFVWIDDVAQAIDLVLNAPESSLGEGVFQVGGAMSLSIHGLAERVRGVAADVLGRDIEIRRLVPPVGAPADMPVEYDLERMRALGFLPSDNVDGETVKILRLLAAR